MKVFQCDKCEAAVFFQNDVCMSCGKALGFLPDVLAMAVLEPESSACDSSRSGTLPTTRFIAQGRLYRPCGNFTQHRVCNWMVPDADPNALCLACRPNLLIPDLSRPGNWERWSKFELAKRRSLYSLLALGLSISAQPEEERPALQFQFMEQVSHHPPVVTGHMSGCMTFDIAESDDEERERRRVALREPYRTLVGHFRHELGHYFWDRWIARTSDLTPFRDLFGDESVLYAEALARYYQSGPIANWQSAMVTPYASAHPWEDWAETWAHYLHIVDGLEVAQTFGISLNPKIRGLEGMHAEAIPSFEDSGDFEQFLEHWNPLAVALNSIHRSIGHLETYPFVLPPPVVRKMAFIHTLVQKHSQIQTRQQGSAAFNEALVSAGG